MLKRINTKQDLEIFNKSEARAKLFGLIEYITKAVTGLETPNTCGTTAQEIVYLFEKLEQLLEQVELVQTKQRFGNIAFREWHAEVVKLLGHLEPEQSEYLSLAFGNPQRLDYGTGHELAFLAYFGTIVEGLKGGDMLFIWDHYYRLSRAVILKYKLEPAGSHGVWGLDDHFHLCYVFGAAQLLHDPNAPKPRDVTDTKIVDQWAPINLYFSAIKFINTVKRGPFFEHSPLLFDASAAANWAKIKNGMTRMYCDNVFDKFPVVQHFVFGENFKFELLPGASREPEVPGSTPSGIAPTTMPPTTTVPMSVMPPTGIPPKK